MYTITIHIGGTIQATVVDLRYRMKEVLQALKRRETVDILYHGKIAGTIIPANAKKRLSKAELLKHPFFGMHKDLGATAADVQKTMDDLRKPRYRDL